MSDQKNEQKLSKVEHIKRESDGLYGSIPDQVESDSTHFDEEGIQLLKHHGTYQQDNRDVRTERRRAKLERDYTMMVRTKTPGGLMTADQYLLCDDLASKYGQEDMRVTSRQGFQFHGVLKGNLRALIHDLNNFQKITTLGACGDVVRNTMGPAIADVDPRYAKFSDDLIAICQEISDHFLPKTTSYVDLWLDDEKVEVTPDGHVKYKQKRAEKLPEDPIYQNRYLPRKFKIGIATDFDNSVDVYTQDVGVIVTTRDGEITGYEVLAGGGLGHSHSKEETYARLGTPVTHVRTRAELLEVIEAIVKVQRDFGNREERHQARLKYTIDRMGEDEFRAKVVEYVGHEIPAATGVIPSEQPDYLGWHKQAQEGLNYVGVWVENGRVRDFDGGHQFRSGLRRIVETFKPTVRLTPHHNVVLAGIKDSDVDAVKALLAEYNIPTQEGVSKLRRLEMACPALPLCGLALAEAERALPGILEDVEKAGYGSEPVMIRMTGCPNSCARPETAEIGIIGRGPNKYHLYTGGDRLGSRMNTMTLQDLKAEEVAPAICKLIDAWKSGRGDGESFGDWSYRVGTEQLQAVAANGAA